MSSPRFAILQNPDILTPMIEPNSNTPYVGQQLDYYPADNQRHAAICTEVHPCDGTERPKVNIIVFTPDGNTEAYLEVSPAQPSIDSFPEIKERWGFQHEFAILQNPEMLVEEEKGSNTNRHIGTIFYGNAY